MDRIGLEFDFAASREAENMLGIEMEKSEPRSDKVPLCLTKDASFSLTPL